MLNKIANFFSLLTKKPSQEQNIGAYESEGTVTYYKMQQAHLQPGEEAIINFLKESLSKFTMLDVGVGAGRTTKYFSSLVNKYTGIDYSTRMVEACRETFPQLEFDVQDVRSLKYPDTNFDFILFSFNGLDSISAEDRYQAIKQIHRTLKPGGYFSFSSHNLGGIGKLFNYPSSFNLKRWYKVIVLRKVNSGFKSFRKNDFAVILDGAHGYEVSNYYTRVSHQIKQLEKAGFENIQVFDLSGNLINGSKRFEQKDLWLYYLCRKRQGT